VVSSKAEKLKNEIRGLKMKLGAMKENGSAARRVNFKN